MGVFEMVAIIVVVSVGGGVWMEHIKSQRRRGGGDIARLEKVTADAQSEIARLKERVKVLEMLATDGDHRLANEIDRLRPGA
jgi:hypothetical protein